MEGSQGRTAASKADTGTMRCFGKRSSQSPLQTRADATVIFTFFLLKFFSVLFAGGRIQPGSRRDAWPPDQRECGCQESEHTCLSTSSGGLRLHGKCKERPLALQDVLQPPAKKNTGPQHKRDRQRRRYKGVRKGSTDPNPKKHRPDSTGEEQEAQEAPPWAALPAPGGLSSSLLPSWPQAQFWVGERPRE